MLSYKVANVDTLYATDLTDHNVFRPDVGCSPQRRPVREERHAAYTSMSIEEMGPSLAVQMDHHAQGIRSILVRPGPGAGATDAGRGDARQPGNVGRHPGCLRQTRADVRLCLRDHTGGAHRVRGYRPEQVPG
jgi:hypothetical protein